MTQDQTSRPLVVLVVDDEALVRALAVEAIHEAGHQTVEAHDAEAAVKLLESQSDIDVMFSDIRMPGPMDGIGLAHLVRRRWPGLPIILTSGHMRMPDISIDATFIAKPYRFPDLVSAIEAR